MKVLDTIKKLLRLGTSSSPHEAYEAIKKARELIRKYRIDWSEVTDDISLLVDEETMTVLVLESDIYYGDTWEYRLAHVVSQFVGPIRIVGIVGDTDNFLHYVVIGPEAEASVGKYMFEYLYDTATRLCDKTEQELRDMNAFHDSVRGDFQQSFLEGFVNGVYDQVQGQRAEQLPSPAERALVLYDQKVEIFMASQFGQGKELALQEDLGSIDAVKNLGYVHGKTVSLNQQVEDKSGSFFKRLIGE